MGLRSFSLIVFFALVPLFAFANDQSKAERDLRRITALASDNTARRVVNAQIAHTFAIDPLTIVKERRALDLTYGDEFLFHELLAAGFDPAQIASQLHSNLSITQVAQSLHADWKRIASDASRFNKSMNDAVYTYFTVEGRRVSAPGEYSPVTDWIKRDATGYQQDDLAWAINTFLSSRSRALRNTGQDGSLGELDYNSFHDRDHIKEKMPPPPPLPSATAARH